MPIVRSGLIGWYRADLIAGVAPGGVVTTWPNSAQYGPVLGSAGQSTAGFKPTWQTAQIAGKPIVRFDGTDDLMTISAGFSGLKSKAGCSIFAVWKAADKAVRQDCISIADGFGATNVRASLQKLATTNLHQIMARGTDNTTVGTGKSSAALGTGFVVSGGVVNLTAATIRPYKNGALDYDSAQVAPTGTTFSATDSLAAAIGQFGASGFLQGDIAEILVYNRPLNPAQRHAVERYLGRKYAIAVG